MFDVDKSLKLEIDIIVRSESTDSLSSLESEANNPEGDDDSSRSEEDNNSESGNIQSEANNPENGNIQSEDNNPENGDRESVVDSAEFEYESRYDTETENEYEYYEGGDVESAYGSEAYSFEDDVAPVVNLIDEPIIPEDPAERAAFKVQVKADIARHQQADLDLDDDVCRLAAETDDPDSSQHRRDRAQAKYAEFSESQDTHVENKHILEKCLKEIEKIEEREEREREEREEREKETENNDNNKRKRSSDSDNEDNEDNKKQRISDSNNENNN